MLSLRACAFGGHRATNRRMILVIDVGNTRLKWAWLTSTGLSDQQAVVHRDAKPGIWTAALFESGQKPTPGAGIERRGSGDGEDPDQAHQKDIPRRRRIRHRRRRSSTD